MLCMSYDLCKVQPTCSSSLYFLFISLPVLVSYVLLTGFCKFLGWSFKQKRFPDDTVQQDKKDKVNKINQILKILHLTSVDL